MLHYCWQQLQRLHNTYIAGYNFYLLKMIGPQIRLNCKLCFAQIHFKIMKDNFISMGLYLISPVIINGMIA